MTERKKTKRPTLKERRQETSAAIQRVADQLEAALSSTERDMDQADVLESVATGLYEELEKLSKKAPVDQATDLVVSHVNDVINDVRAIAPTDAYVQRIEPFVPAGDNPEHRDVVLMLKQIRQGLDRCVPWLERRKKKIEERIATTSGLLVALELYIHHGETKVTGSQLRANNVSLAGEWYENEWDEDEDEYNAWVALDRIDALDPTTLLVELSDT